MAKLLKLLMVAAVIGSAVFWWVTRPTPLPEDVLAGLTANADRGERMFWAGGCASCHAASDATGEARLILAGGMGFPSAFGTFYAPNISPDPTEGIGGWSTLDLANAMTRGISPDGSHYYPAFPYTSYARADLQDIVDLKAFLDQLPADTTPNKAHDVNFPFNIRRLLGGWKYLFFNDEYVVDGNLSAEQQRGRYLAEALGHCGECHTPRNMLGALQYGEWLSGAPDPSGKGNVPNITPDKLDWSELDLVAYFTTGFTPDYDSAGGHMASVVQNLAQLPEEDRVAIAAYLKAVPPVD